MAQEVSHPLGGTRRIVSAVLLVVMTLAAAGVAILATEYPLWAAAGVAVVGVAVILLRRPDLATLLVIFLLYTNAADVAATVHGVPKAIAMGSFLAVGIPLVYYVFVRKQPFILVPAMPLLLLYLAVQVTSALCAKWPDKSLPTVLTYVFEGVAVYFLITNVVRTKEMLRAAMWTLLAAGVVIGGIPLFQYATNTGQNNYWGFGQNTSRGFFVEGQTAAGPIRQARLCGPIGEQNRYAQIMLMLVPLGLCRFSSETSRTGKLLALVAAGIAGGGAMVAFSRGAAVGFSLTILIGAVLGYISRKQTVAVVLAGLLAIAAMPQYWTRLETLINLTRVAASEEQGIEGTDGAIRQRLTLMMAAAKVFFDRPVLGVGPGMYHFYSADYGQDTGIQSTALNRTMQAHVLFLDVAAETGLVGLMSCLAIVVLTLRRLARARCLCQGHDGEMFHTTTGFLLVLIVYLTTGLFLHFMYIRFFWLMMALAAAATWLAEHSAATAIVPQTPTPRNDPCPAYLATSSV